MMHDASGMYFIPEYILNMLHVCLTQGRGTRDIFKLERSRSFGLSSSWGGHHHYIPDKYLSPFNFNKNIMIFLPLEVAAIISNKYLSPFNFNKNIIISKLKRKTCFLLSPAWAHQHTWNQGWNLILIWFSMNITYKQTTCLHITYKQTKDILVHYNI